MQFAGKVVLVTGAQQGIGRAMALEFAAAGAEGRSTGSMTRVLPKV